MKKLAIVQQVAVMLLLNFLLCSCDSTEKDWKNAQMNNSIAEYQKFIKNHSGSVYAVNAQNAVDSMEWVSAIKSKNAGLLDTLLNNYSSSKFLLKSKIPLDSIEWNIANFSRDTVKLRKYIIKYPNSVNKLKAVDIIWDLQWPPLDINPSSITIHSKGKSASGGQARAGFVDGQLGMILEKPTVEIWRDFTPDEEKEFSKIGLIIGVPYTKIDGKYYRLKRKLDLNKSNNEICAEFGFPPIF